MPPIVPPPNPSLVAIILVVTSREGSRFVFHYPEDPKSVAQQDRKKGRRNSYTDIVSSDSDDEDSGTSSEDEVASPRDPTSRRWQADSDSLSSAARRARHMPDDEEDSSSPERRGKDGSNWLPSWENFYGLRARALASLLSPNSRSWHKRRFEIGMNELCFLGWPVFVRDDGTWQKKKHKKTQQQQSVEDGESGQGEEQENQVSDQGESQFESTDRVPGSGDLPEKTANMTMFNVVFVLNPPVLEYSLRVREMYDHIVKKFSKALKWEQSKSNYVWKEAKTILKIKEKAREKRTPAHVLYNELFEQSSLARAMASVFTSISASKIAGPLVMTPETQLTLQIPPITSISVLPSLTDPPTLPGLWLTTANSVSDDHMSSVHAHASGSYHLAKHFALLLLENESAIIKDIISSAGPLAPQLVSYIRSSPPTKSFAKVSAMAKMSLNDIRQLANHLIYWRRARAIPPLHQRDTYIVSPNANLRKLPAACRAYEAIFPSLPSLPKMLSALSGTPRAYGTLIPTKDHKEAYFAILAWLLRGGWVTQLRTFCWVRVDKEVKDAVNKAMKEEQASGRKPSTTIRDGDSASFSSSLISDPSVFSQRPSISSRSFSGSQNSSRADGHSLSNQSSLPTTSARLSPIDLATSSLILNPLRASPLESSYLAYIRNEIVPSLGYSVHHLSEFEVEELQHYFHSFSKEMDGNQPLEKIPIKEGLKRLKTWDILLRLGVGSKETSVDEPEVDAFHDQVGSAGEGSVSGRGKKRIVVTVRHW